MKISIVTAYHNRRPQFINTLKSIQNTTYNSKIEFIVVNDASASEHSIDDLPDKFPQLNMKIFNVIIDKKWWVNPCIPNNMAIALATGDVFLLQNPECLHVGQVLSHIEENIVLNKYIVYGCYAVGPQKTNQLSAIDFNSVDYLKNIKQILNPMSNVHVSKAPVDRWYQHPEFNPSALNFCAAITREDMEDLGGFDERFAEGIAKDDTEFRLRFYKKGMDVIKLAEPFVVHQWHTPSAYHDRVRFAKNTEMFERIKDADDYRVYNKLTDQLIKEVLV
jgi:GT2 family glycosyltransferase